MAIVRTESIERGKEIARGCLQGGVDVMEISYTLPNAGDVIAALNHEFGKTMLVGAGTILDAETCRMAILAGAKFVIAPNFSREVARMCNRYQIPVSYTHLFLMVTYQGFSMIVVALFAIIIAYFYTDLSSKRTGE